MQQPQIPRTKPVPSTRTLNTEFESGFISPLTAIKGILQIMQDYPDLEADKRQQFIENALQACARIENAVQKLGGRVYAEELPANSPINPLANSTRIRFPGLADLPDAIGLNGPVALLDFSDFTFDAPATVDAFFDAIEQTVEQQGACFYFLINFQNCLIWPEAWIAYAHRSKQLMHTYGLASARYSDDQSGSDDPEVFPSLAAALSHLAT